MISTDPALPPHCSVDPGDGGRFVFSLAVGTPWWLLIGRFDGSAIKEGVHDGDVYALQIVDTINNNAIVLDFEQKVTYTEFCPNSGGVFCTPVCDTAEVKLPPLPSP